MRSFAASMLTTAALGAVLAAGCQAPESGASAPAVSAPATGSQPILSRDLDKVSLGKTSPADVERLFGVPEERLADGNLLYRWTGRPSEEGQVTFKFQDGVLSKICRDRT